jgi:hypothetical protein
VFHGVESSRGNGITQHLGLLGERKETLLFLIENVIISENDNKRKALIDANDQLIMHWSLPGNSLK